MIHAAIAVLAVVFDIWRRAFAAAGVLVLGLVGAGLLALVLASIGWEDLGALVFMLGMVAGAAWLHRRMYPEMWLTIEPGPSAIHSNPSPPHAIDSEHRAA